MNRTLPDLIKVRLEAGREKLRTRREADSRRRISAVKEIREAATNVLPVELHDFLVVPTTDVSKSYLDGLVWVKLPGFARIAIAFAMDHHGWERCGPYEVEVYHGCTGEERVSEEDLGLALARAEERGERIAFAEIKEDADKLNQGFKRADAALSKFKVRAWWRRWLGL